LRVFRNTVWSNVRDTDMTLTLTKGDLTMTTTLSLTTLKRAACLLGLTVVLGACASTQNTVSNDDPDMLAALAQAEATTTSNAESGDSMICKKTTVVGSRFNKKVCATAAEWEAREAADRDATANIQRDRTGSQGRN
jgi:hypothetical protein